MQQLKLRAEQVTKRFSGKKGGSITALEQISLQVASGEFVTILGPSGCGKSTFLRIVAGLEACDEGHVFVNEQEVEEPGADRGMVFQSYSLFPWLTVAENVGFGLTEKGVPKAQREGQVRAYLKKMGLEKFADFYPKQLSGGMQQRVAIARALANQPELLLLDEPFGALDMQTRALMQEFLLSVWGQESTTVLFVTHDIDEALFMADRVVVMTARPGRIKGIVDVPLPRPREYHMRLMPDFLQLKSTLTDWVREESLAAMV